MSETTQKVAELKAKPKLQPSQFTQASEFVIPFNHVECPSGHTLQDMLDNQYWVHVANKMQPRGRILVDAEDGSWSAQLVIKAISRDPLRATAVIVKVERFTEFDAAPVEKAPAEEYRVHYVGTRAKWRVSRIADNQTISEGHETEEIAKQALAGHRQALAA